MVVLDNEEICFAKEIGVENKAKIMKPLGSMGGEDERESDRFDILENSKGMTIRITSVSNALRV